MKSISHTAGIAILLTSNGMIAQAKGYPTHDLARCAGIMMGLGKITMRYPGSSQAGLDLWNEGLTTLRLFSTHGTGWEMKTFNDTFKAVEYGGAEALRIAQSMVSPCRKLISKTVADEEKAIKEKAKAREEYLKTPAGKAELAEQPVRDNLYQTYKPSAGYGARVAARIKPNLVLPETVTGNPLVRVEIRTLPDGTIVGRRIVDSSDNADWDEAVLKAIDRASILPRDIDGRVPPALIIGLRPNS